MAMAAAGSLQAKGLAPGDRVGIILTTSVDFLFTFLGVQLAGGIPAALYPPVRLGRLAEYHRRTRAMLSRIGARFLVTESRLKRLLGRVVEGVDCIEGCFLARELQTPDRWEPVEVSPESPALLQFTSGTTSEPRAVIVTHLNSPLQSGGDELPLSQFPAAAPERGRLLAAPLPRYGAYRLHVQRALPSGNDQLRETPSISSSGRRSGFRRSPATRPPSRPRPVRLRALCEQDS